MSETEVRPDLFVEFLGPDTFTRVTMAGDTRVTMAGDTRIVMDEIWIDVTEDVRRTKAISCSRGLKSNGPQDRIAATGNITLYMDNTSNNSGGTVGYYSPGHAGARSGWGINEKMRVGFQHGGTTYPQFAGKIKSIDPASGQFKARDVKVVLNDYMYDLNAFVSVNELELLTNATSDQAYDAIIADMSEQPEGTNFEEGTVEMGFIFNRSDERSGAPFEEINRVLLSAFDMFFVDRGGTITSINKDNRIKTTAAGVVDYSLNDQITNIGVGFDAANDIDKVTVTIHPAIIGTVDETVFELNNTIQVYPGDTVTQNFPYTDPSTSRSVGASGVTVEEFAFGSSDDGVASDLDASLTIIIDERASIAIVSFENTGGQMGFVNVLKLEGRIIKAFDPTDIQNVADINGNVEIKYNCPYQDNTSFAESLADAIPNVFSSETRKVRSVTANANRDEATLVDLLSTEIGTLFHATESVTAIDDDLFVNGINWVFSKDSKLDFTLLTSPARGGTPGIWGTSLWGKSQWRFMEN